ncbi:565_t:CDS:10 [Scutellospora calospora]|uniref:565_t:CDS:1 n=1 Tax=Scutellospora calospora TaxID=85575 RepID=A0ACA9JUX9_9GLOM|nr:565_t:CDS:10 [Scutellospora calospora]
MNPSNTSWNSTRSKSSSKSSENSRTTDKKSIKSLHLSQTTSHDFTSDHEVFGDQKWLDDLVQQRYVKFIPFEEFEDPKTVERANNGDIGIYKSLKWRKMKKRVVIKELKNIGNLTENLRESFVRELQWHLNVDFTERIIRISGLTQETPQSTYILVLQHADGGSLQEYLSRNFKKLTWNDKLTMAKEITEGLRYLHMNNIVHGNLNSRNIMFLEQKLKLTDFGITNMMVSNPLNNFRKISYIDPQILMIYLSTFNSSKSSSIQVPDFSQLHNYYNIQTQKSDIYSLGVIFWELSKGYTPFSDIEHKNTPTHELANAIIKGLRERPVKDVPNGYLKLYTLCWDTEPDKRPGSENVVMMCRELMNNRDSKVILEKNAERNGVRSRGIEEGSGMTDQNQKRITRISDFDGWSDLQRDALAAELWLELEEKRRMGLIEEGDEYYGQEYDYVSVEQSGQQIEEEELPKKEQDISTVHQKNRLSQNLEAQRMKGRKWKSKAKNLVKRLSGRKSQVQDYNNLNIYEDELDEEDSAAGWTSINIDDSGKIDSQNTQSSQTSPISYGRKSNNSLIGRGPFPLHNLNNNLVIEESGPSDTKRPGPPRHGVLMASKSPKPYIYGDQCKMIFLKNKWKLHSQPCYAAYHARIGDLTGIRWHVEYYGDWVLNSIQEVSGPRNSYRRPLEALPIEATMYCSAKKLLPTLTFLKNMGSDLNCIDSYSLGNCINAMSYNTSLLSTSYKSNSYSPYHPTTFNYYKTQGFYFKKVLLYLLDQGLNINSQTCTGDTLLSSILFKWHPSLLPSIIEFLIEQGASPNLENLRGGTPLGYTLLATRFENGGGPFKKVLKILNILLKGGGDCNQEVVIPGRRLRNLGWVCVDVAVNLTNYQQKTLIELLIEWGCEFGTWESEYKKKRKKNRMASEESGIFGKLYADEILKIENQVKGKLPKNESDDDLFTESDNEAGDNNPDETGGAGVGGNFGTVSSSGILNADYSEEIDAIYEEIDDDGNESPVLPTGQDGGSLLTKRLKGKNLKFENPIKIPPLFSSPPTSPLPPTSSLPPIPLQKNFTGQRGILTARDIPVSLLRPLAILNSQINTRGSLPRSTHRLSLFFNPSPKTPTFKPNNPPNILVYAVQLNQLNMVKILLKRIYELSEPKGIIAALKECGVTFDKKESFDGVKDGEEEFVIISKEKYGFFELFKSHDSNYEMKKYLMTWYGKQGALKRQKTMVRIEKMKQKWLNKAKNGYFSSRGIDAEFTMVGSDDYSGNEDLGSSFESLEKLSDLEIIDNEEKEIIDNEEKEIIDNEEKEIIDNEENEIIDNEENEIIVNEENEIIDNEEKEIIVNEENEIIVNEEKETNLN